MTDPSRRSIHRTGLPPISPPPGSPMLRPDFVYGCGTSAYQVEGNAAADGRLESIWDRFCATPGKVLRGETGEPACDHYRRFAEDVQLLADLGLDVYRFSIAWPRVMDRAGQPNERGIDFYKRLLDALQAKGIQSYVTLYHWDLPQHLEDRGGWLNRDTAWRFADYADLVSRRLAGHVSAWTTHNEPWCAAFLGYGNGHQAPGHAEPRWAATALHHLLLGHGLALPRIRANDPGVPVGIVLNPAVGYPVADTQVDRDAASMYECYQNRWVADPLLTGSYPERMWRFWPGAEPLVLPGDMALISQPLDYLGVNYYSVQRLTNTEDPRNPDRFDCTFPEVERTTMGWEVCPQGLEDLLVGMKHDYPNLPPIYITENGMSSDDVVVDGEVDDVQRQSFMRSHLAACSRAMERGVDVRGYIFWSLLDNFEWAFGYERRFGLVHVDYATQQRTPKRSALAFAKFLKARRR